MNKNVWVHWKPNCLKVKTLHHVIFSDIWIFLFKVSDHFPLRGVSFFWAEVHSLECSNIAMFVFPRRKWDARGWAKLTKKTISFVRPTKFFDHQLFLKRKAFICFSLFVRVVIERKKNISWFLKACTFLIFVCKSVIKVAQRQLPHLHVRWFGCHLVKCSAQNS